MLKAVFMCGIVLLVSATASARSTLCRCASTLARCREQPAGSSGFLVQCRFRVRIFGLPGLRGGTRKRLERGSIVGGTLSDRLLIGVGTTGFAKDVEGETLTVGTLDARVRFYPSHTKGFFLNGGVGLGSFRYAGESELGLGVMLGVGWDIRVGSKVSLTPFWNGFAMSNSNVDANVGQLGIGVTIH